MIRKHSVTAFFVFTFIIGLGVMGVYKLTGIQWLSLLAASSSSAAALITAGLTGNLRWLMRGFLRWRCSPWWYVLAIFSPAATLLITVGLLRVFGTHIQIGQDIVWAAVIPMFLLITLQAGLGEEIGWRGFATPKLMETQGPLKSSLIVGAVWAVWHLPLYFVPGAAQHTLVEQIGFPLTFIVYSSLVFAAAITHSWIYEASNRNLWLPILLHGSTNAFTGLSGVADFEVNGLSPIIVNGVLWIILAATAVLVSGPRRFSRNVVTISDAVKG